MKHLFFLCFLTLFLAGCGSAPDDQGMGASAEDHTTKINPTDTSAMPGASQGEPVIDDGPDIDPQAPSTEEPETSEPVLPPNAIFVPGHSIDRFEYRAVTGMIQGAKGAADIVFDLQSKALTGKVMGAHKESCDINYTLSNDQIQEIRDKFDRFYYDDHTALNCAPPSPKPSVFMHINNAPDYIFLTQSTCGFYGPSYYRILEDHSNLVMYIKSLFTTATLSSPDCDAQ